MKKNILVQNYKVEKARTNEKILIFTWMTLIGNPVARANCSLTCLVGFGVWLNASLSTSNSLALIVVLGPRLFPLSSTWEVVWNFINKKIWPKIVWQVFRYFPMKKLEFFQLNFRNTDMIKTILMFANKWAKTTHCL